MKLYYAPGACSLAPHISLLESGKSPTALKVDLRSKKVEDGSDFLTINPKGYVPALALDSGEVLTENVAILSWIADQSPGGRLGGSAPIDRYRTLEWLGFVSSELHKNFSPLFNPKSTPEMVENARGNLARRLGWVDSVLATRQFLVGDQFTVGDAYLWTVMNWHRHVKLDIAQYPAIKAHHERIGARPQVQAALKAEGVGG